MGRIMAIDYGAKRTGVAVSDPLRIIATPLETVPTSGFYEWLARYLAAESVDIIVVGKPFRENGIPSETYPHALGMARLIERAHPAVRVVMFDERYTSKLAHKSLLDSGVRKMERRDREAIDRVSATILLQSFMDSRTYQEL